MKHRYRFIVTYDTYYKGSLNSRAQKIQITYDKKYLSNKDQKKIIKHIINVMGYETKDKIKLTDYRLLSQSKRNFV